MWVWYMHKKSSLRTARDQFLPGITGLNLHCVLAMLYEACFILMTYLTWMGLTMTVTVLKPGFDALPLNQQAIANNPDALASLSDGLTLFVGKLGLAFALAGVITIIIYCISNALIWARLANQRPDLAWIRRWLGTTIPCAILWGAAFIVMAVVFQPAWYGVTVMLWYGIGLYAMTCVHLALTTKPHANRREIYTTTWNLGFMYATHVLAPFTLWLASYLCITFLLGLFINMTQGLILAPYLIVMTIWLRRYLLVTIRNV